MTLRRYRFEAGKLYLFYDDPAAVGEALWGVFEYRERTRISLALSSVDLCWFHCYRFLPARYVCVREATPDQVRRFRFAYTLAASKYRVR